MNYYHTEKGKENILKAVKKYQNTEKGKENHLKASLKYYENNKEKIREYQKEYNLTEKGKEVSKRAYNKFKSTEKGLETIKANAKIQNAKPGNRERRKLWEQSDEGKEKRKAIRARYNLKMKLQKAKNSLSFEENYILDRFILILYSNFL